MSGDAGYFEPADMIAVALAIVAAGTLLVRIGWQRRRALAALGWTFVVAGLTMLTLRDGAWGLAIGTVAALAAALGILAHAGWTSPARPRRPARDAPSITIPRHWPDIARRFAVFALVMPGAFLAAQWLAFGMQAIAKRGGLGASDTTVLALFAQPVLWSVLMTIQMTRANAARMIAPPLVAALLGTICWGVS